MDKNNQFINDFMKLLDGYGTTATQNMQSNQLRNSKPYSPLSNTQVNNRFDYVKGVLSSIQYNPTLGNNYLAAYKKVIDFYLGKLEENKMNLNHLENILRTDIKQFREDYQRTRRRSTLGQVDALEFILKELLYSKHQMMIKIQNSLEF